MAFSALALNQFKEGRGLKFPSLKSVQALSAVLDEIGSPTPEQEALIRISLEGRGMPEPERRDQEKLLILYEARLELDELIIMLDQ
jgi:hypothetical protein